MSTTSTATAANADLRTEGELSFVELAAVGLVLPLVVTDVVQRGCGAAGGQQRDDGADHQREVERGVPVHVEHRADQPQHDREVDHADDSQDQRLGAPGDAAVPLATVGLLGVDHVTQHLGPVLGLGERELLTPGADHGGVHHAVGAVAQAKRDTDRRGCDTKRSPEPGGCDAGRQHLPHRRDGQE